MPLQIEDAEDGHQRDQGGAEGAGTAGVGAAHDPDADADDDEGEQRADGGEVAGHGAGDEGGEGADEDEEEHVGLVGRAEVGVEVGEELGQQAVLRHGVEDAALAEQHDEDDGGEAGENGDGDHGAEPLVTRACTSGWRRRRRLPCRRS